MKLQNMNFFNISYFNILYNIVYMFIIVNYEFVIDANMKN